MVNIWFISDTHFQHTNILKFTGDDGKLIRPGFTNVREMDDKLITEWNAVVKPGDHVWHLGDFAMGNQLIAARLLSQLHGRKRLCVGNHDNVKELAPFFDKVVLWRIWKDQGFICTHIPTRLDQLRHCKINVHGHLHQNLMDDPHYINICVEHTGYKPVHMDEIIAEIKKRNL